MTLPKEFTLAIDELKASIQESQERLERLEDQAKKQIEDNDIIEPKDWSDLSGFLVDEELDVMQLDSLDNISFCSTSGEELNHFISQPMGLADISLIRKIKQNSPWADYEPDRNDRHETKWYISYDASCEKYELTNSTGYRFNLNVYFPSREAAERILKSFLHAKSRQEAK